MRRGGRAQERELEDGEESRVRRIEGAAKNIEQEGKKRMKEGRATKTNKKEREREKGHKMRRGKGRRMIRKNRDVEKKNKSGNPVGTEDNAHIKIVFQESLLVVYR